MPLSAHRLQFQAPEPLKFRRQLRIGPLQQKSRAAVNDLLPGNKQAEARFIIMIPGNIVVKPVAFRSAAGQRRGDDLLILRKLFPDHGYAVGFPVRPRQFKPCH